MQKIRIYELAKKLGVPNKSILGELLKLGIEGKTHSSSIETDLAKKVEAAFVKKPVKPSKGPPPGKGQAIVKPVVQPKEKPAGAHVQKAPPPEEKSAETEQPQAEIPAKPAAVSPEDEEEIKINFLLE